MEWPAVSRRHGHDEGRNGRSVTGVPGVQRGYKTSVTGGMEERVGIEVKQVNGFTVCDNIWCILGQGNVHVVTCTN